MLAQKTETLTLSFNITSFESFSPAINCSLYKDYVFIASRNAKADDVCEIDSLEPGKYMLSVKLDGKPYADYYNVIVKTGHRNYYTYDIDRMDNDTLKDSYGSPKTEAVINMYYGNNAFLEHQPAHNELYMLGLGGANYNPVSKYYSMGQEIMVSGSYINFLNDTSTKLGQPVKHKYYLNANIHFGFINRFTFFDNKKMNSDGLKIDLGIVYNLPIIFRQYERLDAHTRLQTKWIHRYNDFYAMFRIAYKCVGLQAEYNLTTFLKNGYTEIPKYRAGLVFLIPGT